MRFYNIDGIEEQVNEIAWHLNIEDLIRLQECISEIINIYE